MSQDFCSQDLAFLESLQFELPKFVRATKPGKFAFPLNTQRGLVGIATVEGLAASDDLRLQQLLEFIVLAVETRIDAFERLLELEQLEKNTPQSGNPSALSSNIVSLFEYERGDSFLNNYTEETPSIELPLSHSTMELEQPILLLNSHFNYGKTEKDFGKRKIALEIFQQSTHWFFVDINDLADETFQLPEKIKELGKMCIYIPNLAELSSEKQIRLAEAMTRIKELRISGINDLPGFIGFIDDIPQSLIERRLVAPHLLDLMMIIQIPLSLAMSISSGLRIMGERGMRALLQEINETQCALDQPAKQSNQNSSVSNVIPINGKWRPDNSPNPTFH